MATPKLSKHAISNTMWDGCFLHQFTTLATTFLFGEADGVGSPQIGQRGVSVGGRPASSEGSQIWPRGQMTMCDMGALPELPSRVASAIIAQIHRQSSCLTCKRLSDVPIMAIIVRSASRRLANADNAIDREDDPAGPARTRLRLGGRGSRPRTADAAPRPAQSACASSRTRSSNPSRPGMFSL